MILLDYWLRVGTVLKHFPSNQPAIYGLFVQMQLMSV